MKTYEKKIKPKLFVNCSTWKNKKIKHKISAIQWVLGTACLQDYTTIKIISVVSVLGVPQNTTFFIKGLGKIYNGKYHIILFLLSFLV